MQAQPRIAYEPALDGIRGAAVVAVLLFHAGNLRGGYLGVDLFFTLSGFLITSLLLAEVRADGIVRFGAFWARRARRLLPALAVLFVGVALYAWFVARPNELDQIRWDGVWTALYAANWRAVFAKANYWALFAAPSPLQHTWSLAIEEQFYFVWPLVMFAIARRSRHVARTTAWIASGIAVLGSVWLITSFDPQHASRAYYGTDTRVASIAFGAALAALLAARPQPLKHTTRGGLQALGWVGAACIGWLWCALDGQNERLYHGGLTIAAVAATFVIAAAVTQRDGALARVLSLPPLRALGLVSYGAYLYHWPLYVYLTPARTHQHGWTLTGLRFAVTFAVATVSYFAVERPVRRGIRTRRLRTAIGPAPAAVAVLALIATTAGAHPLIEANAGRVDNTIVAVRAAQQAPTGTYRLMLAGSSIAALLEDPIRATSAGRHLVVLNRAVIGCAFPDGITRVEEPGEQPWTNPFHSCGASWRHDVQTFRPDAVLLVAGAGPGASNIEFDGTGHFVTPCTPGYDDRYRADLLRYLHALRRRGTTVYLGTFAYITWPPVPVRWYTHTDCANAIIRSVARSLPGVEVVDFARYLCRQRDRGCRLKYRGAYIRPDGVHYLGPGARGVAEWLVTQMRLAAPSASRTVPALSRATRSG